MWPIPKFGRSEEEKRDHVGGRIRRIAFPISDQSQPAFAESSLSDRVAFASGVFETGLPKRSAEKRAPKQAHEREPDVFSSPVPLQNLQNCANCCDCLRNTARFLCVADCVAEGAVW